MTRARRAKRVVFIRTLLGGALGMCLHAIGCSQTVEVGVDDPLLSNGGEPGATGGNGGAVGGLQLGGTEMGGNTAMGGAPVGTGGAGGCVKTLCRGMPYECGDCDDNDEDGKVDSEDPDCLGPCDNDEKNLRTALMPRPGKQACTQDCYFEGDAGPGNDKCVWTHQCDTLSVAPDYPPSGEAKCAYDTTKAPAGTTCTSLMETQAPECLQTCLPLVPNGCDCFGCCELPPGSNYYYFIGSTKGGPGCELDASGDPKNCPRCTPVTACRNPCEKCENCVGRGADPDPACGGQAACPTGHAPCENSEQCAPDQYCVTGCCVLIPIPT